jgi:dienelactone hydrolase
MAPRALPWWATAALALAATSFGLGLAARDALDAQVRAAVVLSTALETPVVTWTAERLTAVPEVAETTVVGAPATIARPPGDGPWPALVVVNGATPRGRFEPGLQRLVRGLARAGFLAVLPDLPGLPDGEIGEPTVAAAAAVALEVASMPEARDGRVGLVGVSVGTSLALLAAARPELADSVSVVAGTAPYGDLENVIRLATTGWYRDGNLLIRYETDPFLAVAVARSLAAAVPPGPERRRLVALADGLEDRSPDPLAPVRAVPLEVLEPETRAVVELLANDDPLRFDTLYAALPAEVREAVAALSPATVIGDVRAPIELATAPADEYVPPAEPRALARAAPAGGRVTVTGILEHAEPAPSLRDLPDLLRFDGWVLRTLARARGRVRGAGRRARRREAARGDPRARE